MTTETKDLYTTEYGQILCADHLGYYDSEAMELTSSRVLDFLGLEKATKRDRDEWLAELGQPMDCETCRYKK